MYFKNVCLSYSFFARVECGCLIWFLILNSHSTFLVFRCEKLCENRQRYIRFKSYFQTKCWETVCKEAITFFDVVAIPLVCHSNSYCCFINIFRNELESSNLTWTFGFERCRNVWMCILCQWAAIDWGPKRKTQPLPFTVLCGLLTQTV